MGARNTERFPEALLQTAGCTSYTYEDSMESSLGTHEHMSLVQSGLWAKVVARPSTKQKTVKECASQIKSLSQFVFNNLE